MINAQEWLNQQFPTPQSKAAIKFLAISNMGGTPMDTGLKYEELHSVVLNGEMNLNDFPNLEKLVLAGALPKQKVTRIQADQLTKLTLIHLNGCPNLTFADFSNCAELCWILVRSCPNLKFFTFLDRYKQEIQSLKAQLTEYESPETTSDPSEPLNTKIQRKKAELSQAITSDRKSTAPLRKEIELLEKIQGLETQINTLQAKETGYQQQIQQKEQAIQAKQSQITNLQSQLDAKTTAEKQAQTKITQLEKQLTDLQAEKQALQEKLLKERQEAVAQWEQEKTNLTQEITQLNEQKDTFQKSADYLRSTLKDTERNLEETKNKLTDSEKQSQEQATSQQAILTQKEEELAKKQETYALIQERNKDLQGKLALASEEITKLTEWISKLEAASSQGDAFVTLQSELSQAQQTIQDLEEQLSAKSPQKSYLWLYAILALVALYFIVK